MAERIIGEMFGLTKGQGRLGERGVHPLYPAIAPPGPYSPNSARFVFVLCPIPPVIRSAFRRRGALVSANGMGELNKPSPPRSSGENRGPTPDFGPKHLFHHGASNNLWFRQPPAYPFGSRRAPTPGRAFHLKISKRGLSE